MFDQDAAERGMDGSANDIRWTAPPNWPAAPADWVPEPGWRPLPEWGPSPEGWAYWRLTDCAADPSLPGEHRSRELDSRLRPHIQSGATPAASFLSFLGQISEIASAAFDVPGPLTSEAQEVRARMLESMTAATALLEEAIKEGVAPPFVFFACIQDAVSAAAQFGDVLSDGNRATDTAQLMPKALSVRNWKDAEALAVWHMRQLGFDDARGGPKGNDRGIDVHSAEAVAQVKHYASGTIGAPIVQQARGAAYGKKWVLFYALSGYTAAAQEFAEQASVALFRYDVDGQITPISTVARQLTMATHSTLGDEMQVSESASQQQEAQVKAQKLFDATFARVMTVLNEAIAQAERGGRRGQVARKALEERHEVQRLVGIVGTGTMDLKDFLSIIDQLDDCGRRMAAALGVAY
ncbi:restriction endonuclease [Micromonospora purpureochromogenes]|uniref:restriction endonuclease n=1 Tax=Micromonospora purpureochromogenes TaxID=47872 RepID=UPI0033EE7E4A